MRGPSQSWDIEEQQLLEVSVPELATLILQDCDANYGRDDFFNFDSWRDSALRAYGTRTAKRAIVEAWDWIRLKGLVAQDPSQSSPAFVFITRLGIRFLDEGLAPLKIQDRLDVDVSPILGPAKALFLMGKSETAAFESLKAVEVRVRELAGLGNDLTSTKLMRAAFQPGSGPLTDLATTGGEQVALMELFAGAIGSFKNPSSHRVVDYEDSAEAAEVILLADLLMRLLDRVERRTAKE